MPPTGWLAFCLSGLLSLPYPATANRAGGFTTLVTKAVTTGTESFGSATDHYLDNGILHVDLSSNGSVDSMKYLKPGTSGTPAANGTETVSQSGANFSNHTAIYYYWYPDGNGDCVYSNTMTGATNIDICYFRPFSQANGDKVIADVELHYSLGKGNTGLYAYLIVRHPTNYVAYATNLSISFIQVLWPTAHDATNFFFEDSYVDNGVRYGLNLGGVYQKRNGLQPSFWDNYHQIAVTNINIPKEVTKYTTGVFAGSTNGKYSFTFDFAKLSAFGMASDTNKMGIWYVAGGHEYQQNGPPACEYSGGIGGIIGFEPLMAHYGNTGLNVSSNAAFTKLYGPWLFYINTGSNGAACWADAQQQALAEQQAWPYAWLTNSACQARNQRASIAGKLVINDPLRPAANAAGAWIGLAAPDAGLEVDPNDWQWQSDGYQFWTQCAADGTFTLPPVTTFTPYGSNAVYELYAYCAGTNGSVGQYQTGPLTFAPGTVTNLGTLTWNVPHPGSNVLWEIGYPDRTADKFRHGDDYAIPGLWLGFADEFPNPMTYTIGSSNPTNDWNYAQTAYFTNGVANNMIWNLQFNVPKLPASGNATLTIAWAGAYSAAIAMYVNNPGLTTEFKDFYPNIPFPTGVTADSLIRQGIHDKYGIDHLSIPVGNLVAGTNTITLVQRRAVTATVSYVMYDYLDFELPTPMPPAGLAASAGDARVALTWTASPGANGYYVYQSTNNAGPYKLIGTNVSSLTLTNSGLTNGWRYYYSLAATNAFGASAVSPTISARPTAATPPPLSYTLAPGQITLGWPAGHTGWRLVTQTNSLLNGLGTNWVTVPGSMNTNQMSLPVNNFNGCVFFQLVNP